MSIFFDFDVCAPGRRFRRAVDDDKADIELFLDRKHTEQIFGEVDIGRMIELSTLSICMINENKEVVGFMSLCDHPNVIGLAPDNWETWIRNMFQKYYLSRSTLFIHFMCCKDSILDFFMEEACTSVFHNDMYLANICLIPHAKCHPEIVSRYQVLKKRTMCKYNARRSDDSDTRPYFMLVANRPDYCPRLKIRRAVEEDNDDIVKVLEKKCPLLKELYGSYYISELIGRHPESKRKIIVPEYQDHAVGVMCLSSDINYKKLQDLYELRPYYGLMKATPLEKEHLKRNNMLLHTYGEPIMTGKFSPFIRPSELHEINSSDSFHLQPPQTNTPQGSSHHRQKIKVNFKRTTKNKTPLTIHLEEDVHISDDYSAKVFMNSPSPSIVSYKSLENLMLEDDPFDYEIVNIDKSLLSLAESFSHELVCITENKLCQSSTMLLGTQSEPQICRRKKSPSVISKTEGNRESELNLYSGEPNAFIIELFGLRDDVDERNNSMELLVAAFEIMKDYDYCVISVPTSENTFSLLQHFTYVPVREKRCSEYCLYVAHRASVLGRLRVREAEFIDIPLIARFLQNLEGSETIYTIEHSILDRESYQAYVFMSGLSMIGIGILEPPEQLNFIRTKYNTDPYHNHQYHLAGHGSKTGFAAIKVILVYPVFEVHHRFFMREMMRLSGCSSLIWMTAYRNKLVAHKANSLASAMVPLLPRQFEIDCSKMPELNKIAAMTKLPFSTWFLDKKLTSVPMVTISTRILIIGASRTCMAFLNALLFSNTSTYLNFTNVTLISSHGFPYIRHTYAAVETMFPKYYNTSEKYLKSVPYTYYVNTINGTVVEINKQEKYIALTNGSKFFYDILFLFFGKQYQHPDYLKPLIQMTMQCTKNKPYVRMDVPNKYVEPDYINYNTPHNVFIINHVVQASNALKHVSKILNEGFDVKIIVYGSTIHAYCCLTALLEIKVPPESIVYIDPFPSEDPSKTRVSVFYNANVDESVCKVLNSLNVQVYRSYYFQSWTTVDNIVTHVEFLSKHRIIKLECSAFFYYGKRGVNSQAFLAVNKSGMAYDGGILIDHQCRTKDPSIYAAGPCTAYHRRYYAQTKKHKYYDAHEVGEKLGNQIRNQLDPLFTDKSQRRRSSVKFSTDPIIVHPSSASNRSSDDDSICSDLFNNKASDTPNKRASNKLPHFVKPRVIYCRLPGGLQYLEVRSPGKKVPHYYVQSLNYSGVVMETFKSGYFKLHLTNELIVDGITCLTYDKFSLENFKNLYGKSSVILNHLHLRYTTKKLDDFFEYFRSPWAHFLYHDQVDELLAMVKEVLPKGSTTDTGTTLTEALRTVRGVLNDSMQNSSSRKKIETSPYIEAVTDYVMRWVSQNNLVLPMYLHPSDRADFVHDMGRNPMFRRKRNSLTNLIRKVF